MRKAILNISAILSLWLLAPERVRSATGPLDLWQRELPTPAQMLGYFKGEFFATPGLSASSDGWAWEQRLQGSSILLAAKDQLVVPLTAGLYISSDGRKFTKQQLPTFFRFGDLAYGNGHYVAYLSQSQPGALVGSLMWSPDARTWSMTTSNLSAAYVEFANTNFFAWIRTNAEGAVGWSRAVSSDGLSWDYTALPAQAPIFNRLAYGNGVYVGIGAIQNGNSYTNVIATFTSPDDVIVRRSSATNRFSDVLFDGTKFVVVGNGTLYSQDGVAWESGNLPQTVELLTIAYGNGTYLAAQWTSRYTSRDGITWTRQSEDITRVPSVTFGEDRFVAFADAGASSYALVSTNRGEWTFVDLPVTNEIEVSLYAQNRFLGMGGDGVLVRSGDGFSWEAIQTGLSGEPKKILFEADRYYALLQQGSGARIYSTQNPEQWQLAAALEDRLAHALAVNGQTFVVSSGIFPTQPALLNTSTNGGVTWSSFSSQEAIRDLVFANGRFVGVGDYGYVVTSQDGLTWKEIRLPNKFLTSVQFGGGLFVTAGELNQPVSEPGFDQHMDPKDFFFTSSDGENWTKHYTRLTGQVLSLAYGDRSWVFGLDGAIMRSKPIVPFFRAEDLQFAGQTGSVAIDNPAGEEFTVEISPDLRNWTTLTNASGSRIDLEAGAKAEFFRIREE